MAKLLCGRFMCLTGVVFCLCLAAGGCTGVGVTMSDVFTEMFLADSGAQENAWTVVTPGGSVLAVKIRNDIDQGGFVDVRVTSDNNTDNWTAQVGPTNLIGRVFDIPEATCQSSTMMLRVEAEGYVGSDDPQHMSFILPLVLIRSQETADLGILKFRDFGCGDTIEFVIQEDPSVSDGYRLAGRIYRHED